MTTQQSGSNTPDSGLPTTGAADGSPRRHALVLLAIAIVTGVFFVAVSIVYFYSHIRVSRQPAAAVVAIVGDTSYEGATVSLEGTTPPPWNGTLSKDNHYTFRMHIPPGVYGLKIQHKGAIIVEYLALTVVEYQYWVLRLPASQTQPAN